MAAGTLCDVAGWGVVTHAGRRPDRLQYLQLPVLDRATCNLRIYHDGTITERMMCAQSTRRQDSCKVLGRGHGKGLSQEGWGQEEGRSQEGAWQREGRSWEGRDQGRGGAMRRGGARRGGARGGADPGGGGSRSGRARRKGGARRRGGGGARGRGVDPERCEACGVGPRGGWGARGGANRGGGACAEPGVREGGANRRGGAWGLGEWAWPEQV